MFPSKQKCIAAFSTNRNLSGGRFNFSSGFGGKFKILNWRMNIQTMRNFTFVYAQSSSCSTPQNTSQRVGWGSIPRQWIEYSIDKWLRNGEVQENRLSTPLFYSGSDSWVSGDFTTCSWCMVAAVLTGRFQVPKYIVPELACVHFCANQWEKGTNFGVNIPPSKPDYSTIQCLTSESFYILYLNLHFCNRSVLNF